MPYSTTTCLTVSLQNGTGHSPARSVSTSNSGGRWTAQEISYPSQYLLRAGQVRDEAGLHGREVFEGRRASGGDRGKRPAKCEGTGVLITRAASV